MEAKVETIEQEINQLKVKNQQLSDNLKVKDKMCDDHNDTILQLKQVTINVVTLSVCYHGDLVDTGCTRSHDPRVTRHMAEEGTRVSSSIRTRRID